MSGSGTLVFETADALRRAFDRSFSEPPPSIAPVFEDFLKIQVGGDPHVLRLSELAGLHAGHRIVPVPGPPSALAGIAGFRNTIVPVYDLRTLLGYGRAAAPRWLALARASQPVALGFDRFDAFLRVERGRLSPRDAEGLRRPCIGGSVQAGEETCPLIDVAAVVEEIVNRARAFHPFKEE